jgi:hypothetical protein
MVTQVVQLGTANLQYNKCSTNAVRQQQQQQQQV